MYVSGDDMHFLLFVGMIALGLLQIVGFMAGLEAWLGLHWFLSIIIAMVIFNIPFAGIAIPVLAYVGFTQEFRWEWWQAALAAAPGLALMIVSMMGGGLIEIARKLSRG